MGCAISARGRTANTDRQKPELKYPEFCCPKAGRSIRELNRSTSCTSLQLGKLFSCHAGRTHPDGNVSDFFFFTMLGGTSTFGKPFAAFFIKRADSMEACDCRVRKCVRSLDDILLFELIIRLVSGRKRSETNTVALVKSVTEARALQILLPVDER